ncbi:gag pro pol polyprotein [Echinococcus multilocularis]|uniref:Gag pro pol polyprotein n=1 Tax=Echinococcus multilocularis TaxID=6211 RepID=A0A068Y163_ECHMU|nr:gag pro pol polyprotein [Echinococcus multilocularis]
MEDEALHLNLAHLQATNPQVTHLQYVDDILLAADCKESCFDATDQLLQEMGTTEQLREIFGTAGFCWLWIPGFAKMVALLHALTKGSDSFIWGKDEQAAFDNIKQALILAPALGLPDVTKPFHLYVAENQGMVNGVLTQKIGPWKRPDLTICAPHALESVIRQPPDCWLMNARMTHYQALLLNDDRVTFAPATGLNPATLLPDPQIQVLAEEQGWRKDMKDQPLPYCEMTYYMDGSSFGRMGKERQWQQ